MITVGTLAAMNACKKQTNAFERWLEGRPGVDVGPETVRSAQAAGLDVGWFIARTRDPEILERLATDASVGVRCGVARNTATPSASLERLATDASVGVRWRVAENTATPSA